MRRCAFARRGGIFDWSGETVGGVDSDGADGGDVRRGREPKNRMKKFIGRLSERSEIRELRCLLALR